MLPATDDLLRAFGERLRLARLRRRLPANQVAERAGMSPMTLRSLERGGSGVTMGAYLAVMQVLGIEQDLDLLGKADPMGRELQDARLPAYSKTKRASATSRIAAVPEAASIDPHTPAPSSKRARKPVPKHDSPLNHPQDWIVKSGFASAHELASLITKKPTAKKSR